MSRHEAECSIRPATNRDLPAIREVVFSVLTEYGLRPDPGATDRDLDDIEASYVKSGGVFQVVVAADDEIVGTAGLMPLSDRRAELRKMYVKPAFRGRGLGKRLLENMLDAARRRGFDQIWLETNAVLREAIALYRRYGFAPVPCDHLSPRCDQAYLLELGDLERPSD